MEISFHLMQKINSLHVPGKSTSDGTVMSSLLAALATLKVTQPLAVAYSGGADSTALLHAAALQWPGQVRAIHIHHGLQAAADDFVRHCEATCAALGVPLHVVHVQDALGIWPFGHVFDVGGFDLVAQRPLRRSSTIFFAGLLTRI